MRARLISLCRVPMYGCTRPRYPPRGFFRFAQLSHYPDGVKGVRYRRPSVWQRGEGYTFTINRLTPSYGHSHKPYHLTCDADGRIPTAGHEVCASNSHRRRREALNEAEAMLVGNVHRLRKKSRNVVSTKFHCVKMI